jgi:hypothetical protein
MTTITYQSTKLRDMSKSGKLRPDSSGYYDLVLGAMNTTNSAGQYYTLKGCESIFENSSILMRRIKAGNCYGEIGHPVKRGGMSRRDYFRRLLTIRESNVGTHIREISLDSELWKTRPGLIDKGGVAIIGKIKPAGPKAESVKMALENPHENLAYSVRSFTKDQMLGGRVNKTMVELVTYDSVSAPGIPIANKWAAPGLEASNEEDLFKEDLEYVLDEIKNDPASLEADDLEYVVKRLLNQFESETTESNETIIQKRKGPIYLGW